MCRWVGSHFHDCIDYHEVAFSIEFMEWGRTFSDFWRKIVRHIYGTRMFVLKVKGDVFFMQYKIHTEIESD